MIINKDIAINDWEKNKFFGLYHRQKNSETYTHFFHCYENETLFGIQMHIMSLINYSYNAEFFDKKFKDIIALIGIDLYKEISNNKSFMNEGKYKFIFFTEFKMIKKTFSAIHKAVPELNKNIITYEQPIK